MSTPQLPERATPLLCLDLDGTVRKGKGELGRFVNGPEDVEVFPEAIEMMRRWKAGGGRIIGVSNQGGIALGLAAYPEVAAAMRETHVQAGRMFDKIAFCGHHPEAASPEMARCWCRKPSPGLIIESALALAAALGEYYPPYMGLMVGDRPEDQECARLAGLDFQWAADWRAQAGTGEPSMTVPSTGESPDGHLMVLRGTAALRDAEIKRLRQQIAEYENAVNWQTSCTSCATVLGSSARETFRAEVAEAKLAAIHAQAFSAPDSRITAAQIFAIISGHTDGAEGSAN